MIPVTNTDTVINEQSGVTKSFDAHIKNENLHIILEFLRNKCYSDPVRAIVREYGTNAQDIHNRHGITQPIQISLPNELDSFFKVRDFGPALTNERLGDLFLSYGESDKRNTNTETGSLGLGCKCGFAYGDSFLINAYRNGKLSIWNMYIDPSKRGKADLMAETDTTEPDGLEVVIPVKAKDIPEFRSKALEVYSFFAITPNIVNLQPSEKEHFANLCKPTVAFEGQGWKYLATRRSVAIMANVAYSLSHGAFTENELSSDLRHLLDAGLHIEFPNGGLEFAISREELQYTDNTKKTIAKRLKEIADEIATIAEAKFNGCKTLWDAKLMWKEVFRMDGSLYHVRELFNRRIKFNGKPLNESYFSVLDSDEMEVLAYRKGYNTLTRDVVHHSIEVDKNLIICINDTDIVNGIKNRVVKPLHETMQIAYVIKFKNAQAEAKWRQESGFDGPTQSLKDMEKVALNKYYSSDFGSNSYFSPKHSSKEFSYVTSTKSRSIHSYRSKRSDYWEVVDVDLDSDAGVYLELDPFEYKNGQNWGTHPRELQPILDSLTKIGIALPTVIYGFKKSSVNKVKNNQKMVSFWTWIDAAISAHCAKDTALVQDFINRKYVRDRIASQCSYLPDLTKIVSKWNSMPATSQLVSFFTKVNQLLKYDEAKLEALESLLRFTSFKPTGNPVCEVLAEQKTMASRYPLLFKTGQHLSSYHWSDWKDPMTEYVTMVDTLTP